MALAGVDTAGLLAEHHSRRRTDSLQFPAIGYEVEIGFENLALGPSAFDRKRGLHLKDLLPHAPAPARRSERRVKQRRKLSMLESQKKQQDAIPL